MENVTTEQLDGAVAKLIEAYSLLQNKYETLENDNSALKNTITQLEEQNNNLKQEMDKLGSNTKEQESHIGTMFSKIETMLKSEPKKIDEKNEQKQKPSQDTVTITSVKVMDNKVEDNKVEDNLAKIEQNIESQKEQVIDDLTNTPSNSTVSNTQKIDMSRIESLLKGH
jgi:FtsZ-binding cell division protein ZapB